MKLPMRNVSRATPGDGVGRLTKGRKSPMGPAEAAALLAPRSRAFGAPTPPPAWVRERMADREATKVLTGVPSGRVGKVCGGCRIVLPLLSTECPECAL